MSLFRRSLPSPCHYAGLALRWLTTDCACGCNDRHVVVMVAEDGVDLWCVLSCGDAARNSGAVLAILEEPESVEAAEMAIAAFGIPWAEVCGVSVMRQLDTFTRSPEPVLEAVRCSTPQELRLLRSFVTGKDQMRKALLLCQNYRAHVQ